MSIQRIIDGVPSEEFYSAFHYTKILKLLGYDGTAKPGSYVRCTKCKTASMYVSALIPFGGWMYCDKCKLSCEGLRLYGQAYKISNPDDLVYKLAEELKIKDLSMEDLISYSTFYRRYYERVLKVWEIARNNMFPTANRFATSRLSELNLWIGQEVYNRGFTDWFGYAYKHEIEELLEDKIHGFGKATEGLLVIPFYLKPGFISGFGFIGNKDQLNYLNVLDGHYPGYCGLNSCHKDPSEAVYVLDHPLQAARIVQKCTVERYNKLSVVAKSPVGQLDPLLLPKSTIVWTDAVDTAFLKTCIKSKNFKVMIDDTPYIWRPVEKISKLWEGSFMPKIHKQVSENNLMDPLDFLTTELITMGTANARNAVDAMELSAFQRNLILASCSDTIREEMEDILGNVATSQPIMIDKKIVFEKDGKLWMQGSREVPDELICNAIVRITNICRSKQDGRASLFGKFLFEGKEVGFQMEERFLESDPAKALAFISVNAGISKHPFLLDSISKKYLDIILRLSSPEVHAVQNYVGYDSDTGRFNLPRMSIDPHQIRVGIPFVMGDVDPPCTSLAMDPGITIKSVANLFDYGPETVAYMAGMASMLSGIHAVINESSRTNTLFVGNKGSLAEYVFDVLRIDLGLESVVLHSKDDMEYAHALATVHHVPIAIDGNRSKPKLLAQWLEGQGLNSLVVANSVVASSIAADKDWAFVRADTPFPYETKALINSENVFPFFMQYSLTVKHDGPHSFLDNLKYLAKSLDKSTEVIDAAKAMVSTKGYINSNSAAAHLINFIHEGVESGMFKTFTGDSTKKRYVILKNPMEDTVAVDLTNLLGQMRYYNIPVVTWESAVMQLKELGVQDMNKDGVSLLVFPKPIWNTLVSAIKRLKGLRKAALINLFNAT